MTNKFYLILGYLMVKLNISRISLDPENRVY